MLIARLIAGFDDWETRLAAARATLRVDAVSVQGSSGPLIEMRFESDDPASVWAMIDAHFAGCDALVASAPIAVPRLFISDMDSTMIGQECIDELADYAGLKHKIAAITERAMQGELDFESALKERVRLLAGLEEGAIERCLKDRITPSPGAATLVATLKAHGCRCVLVTGGFHHFADRVGEALGFDRVVGNTLGVEAGRLTGDLVGPICHAGTKAAVLHDEAAKLGEGANVLATGDGANDIPMIEAATYGFAYLAKPKAKAAANGRIDRGDLSAILTLLGIDKKDWIAA